MKKKVMPIFARAVMLLLVAVFSAATAWGQTYESTEGTDGEDGEGYENLFDDDTSSKWCVAGFNGMAYVEFFTNVPITPKGYVLTTGDDNSIYPGRNPKSWTIKAKANASDEWTVLTQVTNDWKMQDENEEHYYFYFPNTTAYQFFRFEISAVQHGSVMQLSEFSFLDYANSSDLGTATVQGASRYIYNGSPINLGKSLIDVNGNVIPEDKYTLVIFNEDDDEVSADNVTELGDYKMFFTPTSGSDYSGQLEFHFSVRLWQGDGGYCGNPDKNNGENVFYDMVTVGGKKTLYIKKNPNVPSTSDFSMRDYDCIEDDEDAVFAPWINADRQETNYGDDEDPFYWFECYLLSCDVESVVIESGVTSIGAAAFYSCLSLTSVTIPASVTSIGNAAFSYSGLTSLNIADGVTSIGDGAFSECPSLTSVTIPASVTSIGVWAFSYCYNLATITLNSNPFIGDNAFNGIKDGATVTMNLPANLADGAKWTTFYNQNYGFQADVNTKVFKVELSGTTLTMHEVDSKIVDYNTAVVLKTTGDGNPVMTLTTSDSNDSQTNNLNGVADLEGLETDGTFYVLGNGTKGVGFYKLASGKKVGLGKAYLSYSGGGAREFFSLDETTGIEDINRETITNNRYYDMQGRRVENPTNGIYIVNGKKVVIK